MSNDSNEDKIAQVKLAFIAALNMARVFGVEITVDPDDYYSKKLTHSYTPDEDRFEFRTSE